MTRIKVNPLVWPLAVAALLLGEGARLGATACALLMHELAHIAAARVLGMGDMELEIMPFGGAARLPGLWLMSPAELLAVSLAGPGLNLLVALVMLASRGLGAPITGWGALFFRANIALAAFNLLPALPLDGGRALVALLTRRLSTERAARIGVNCGRALAALLVALTVATRSLNVTLLLAAAIVLLSGGRELADARAAAIKSLLARAGERREAAPLRLIAVREGAPLARVLPLIRPGQAHLVASFDGEGRLQGFIDERELLRALAEDSPPRAALGAPRT